VCHWAHSLLVKHFQTPAAANPHEYLGIAFNSDTYILAERCETCLFVCCRTIPACQLTAAVCAGAPSALADSPVGLTRMLTMRAVT
jgi:hypothetical protein